MGGLATQRMAASGVELSYGGVDPGMDGFLAVLQGRLGFDAPQFHPLPTLPTGKGAKRMYDVRALFRVVRELFGTCTLVMLEKQRPMKGQGVSSMFSTGYGYGLIKMALVAAEIPYEEVAASSWKAKMSLRVTGGAALSQGERQKQAKALAIDKAQSLYPDVDLRRNAQCRTPSADKAEALLLARYAKHRSLGVPL